MRCSSPDREIENPDLPESRFALVDDRWSPERVGRIQLDRRAVRQDRRPARLRRIAHRGLYQPEVRRVVVGRDEEAVAVMARRCIRCPARRGMHHLGKALRAGRRSGNALRKSSDSRCPEAGTPAPRAGRRPGRTTHPARSRPARRRRDRRRAGGGRAGRDGAPRRARRRTASRLSLAQATLAETLPMLSASTSPVVRSLIRRG